MSSLHDSFFPPKETSLTSPDLFLLLILYRHTKTCVRHNAIFTQASLCFKRNIHFRLCFQSGHFSEDMIPTVGFNMRKVSKGNVTIKVFFPSLVVTLNQSSLSIKENMIMQLLIEFLVNIVFFFFTSSDLGYRRAAEI